MTRKTSENNLVCALNEHNAEYILTHRVGALENIN